MPHCTTARDTYERLYRLWDELPDLKNLHGVNPPWRPEHFDMLWERNVPATSARTLGRLEECAKVYRDIRDADEEHVEALWGWLQTLGTASVPLHGQSALQHLQAEATSRDAFLRCDDLVSTADWLYHCTRQQKECPARDSNPQHSA